MLANRPLKTIITVPFQKQHWVAFYNMYRNYEIFYCNFRRYVIGGGKYPYECKTKTPTGLVAPTLYSHHDLLTVNEIFCRLDYLANTDIKVVVDVGSNIGISALYFLTRNKQAKCYLFEPDPNNIPKLHHNLSDYKARYELHEKAVSDENAEVKFGIESTGRYGGIDVKTGNYISVACLDINEVLENILSKEKQIDILKLDIEGAELKTIAAIKPSFLKRIKHIYIEAEPETALHTELFQGVQYGSVYQMTNKYL